MDSSGFLKNNLLQSARNTTVDEDIGAVPTTTTNKGKRLDWKKICFIRKVCCYVFLFSLWIALFIVSYPDVINNYEYTISSTKSFKIVLFGDSLINVGCTYYNLAEKLQHQFPQYTLTIINAGVNGNKIADMKARMYSDVVDLHPDAVIIYWDSDDSDLSLEQIEDQSTLQTYEADCISVFTTCQNASRYIAVAGPGILSEGPIFHTNQWSKKSMLDTYRSINRNISEAYHIPYIDMRGSLQSAIPNTWLLARWFVTSDGEHGNARGTRIIAREFGKVLNGWLTVENENTT